MTLGSNPVMNWLEPNVTTFLHSSRLKTFKNH